jgi:hypothetical protein
MNKLIASVIALTVILTIRPAQAVDTNIPEPPSLAAALKLPNTKVLAFRPTRMGAESSLSVTHVRLGDGSVRPGEKRGAMLLVYSSVPDEQGNHSLLMQDFHFLTNTGSPVLNFERFRPRTHAGNFIDPESRVGIIAILIGFQQNPRTGVFTPAALPPLDTIVAEVTPTDGILIGLLLPAVQKVRSAAAR